MADVTYYVALSFVMSDDGPATRDGFECPSASAAILLLCKIIQRWLEYLANHVIAKALPCDNRKDEALDDGYLVIMCDG